MKKEVRKIRRYLGVPIAVWLVIALSGTAVAWYSFNTIRSSTDVQEPLLTASEDEFSETMYPGQSNTWSFNIVNSASIGYDVKADLTFSAPRGVTIHLFAVTHADGSTSVETADLTDDGSAGFRISAGETISCKFIITAANDATPGPVTASFALSRGVAG